MDIDQHGTPLWTCAQGPALHRFGATRPLENDYLYSRLAARSMRALREAHLAGTSVGVAMLRDDATRAKQESVGEVAEAGFRAGAEWAERGGVLPRTQAVCAPFLRLEKALAASSHGATAAGQRGSAICGSETGGRGEHSRRLAG